MSAFNFLNLPDAFIYVLLCVALAFYAAAFVKPLDFGIIKVPEIDELHKAHIKKIIPFIIALIVLGNIEFFGRSGGSHSKSSPYALTLLEGTQDSGRLYEINFLDGSSVQFSDSEVDVIARRFASGEPKNSLTWVSEDVRRQNSFVALADLAFANKDYATASRLYNQGKTLVVDDETTYQQISGMVTAGLYGSGRHRAGLSFICSEYAKLPSETHKYRFAAHAHIRALALRDGYSTAEQVISELRQDWNCSYDDISPVWIPVPLAFMEALNGSRFRNVELSERERKYVDRLLGENHPFEDHLLLLLNENETVKKVITDYPQSYVRDIALSVAFKSAIGRNDVAFAKTYLSEFPSGSYAQDATRILLADILKNSETSHSLLSAVDDLWLEFPFLRDAEFVWNYLLNRSDLSISRAVSEAYIAKSQVRPHAEQAIGIIIGDMAAKGVKSDRIEDRFATFFSARPDLALTISVAQYRASCEERFEHFSFRRYGEVADHLERAHKSFYDILGTDDYAVDATVRIPSSKQVRSCGNALSGAKAKINGADLTLLVAHFRALSKALNASQDGDQTFLEDTASTYHTCVIRRARGVARDGEEICGAFSRVFGSGVSITTLATKIHSSVYNLDREKYHRNLFLKAMVERRTGKIDSFLKTMNRYAVLHSDSDLADDALAELGWYYLHTEDFETAQRYFEQVILLYPDENAADNALNWMVVLFERQSKYVDALKFSWLLGKRITSDRLRIKIDGRHERLFTRAYGSYDTSLALVNFEDDAKTLTVASISPQVFLHGSSEYNHFLGRQVVSIDGIAVLNIEELHRQNLIALEADTEDLEATIGLDDGTSTNILRRAFADYRPDEKNVVEPVRAGRQSTHQNKSYSAPVERPVRALAAEPSVSTRGAVFVDISAFETAHEAEETWLLLLAARKSSVWDLSYHIQGTTERNGPQFKLILGSLSSLDDAKRLCLEIVRLVKSCVPVER